MPSTNHSHACKKFVPQRALAYTLSETYVGREKIDPYLQILYYIFDLAKKIVIKMAENIQNLQRIRLYSISSLFYIPMFSTLCLKNRIHIFQKLRLKNMLV